MSGQPEAPAIPGVTRWRRKTAETEAIQWTGENLEAIREFTGNGSYMTGEDGILRVLGPDGWRRVDVGWWVGREGRELFTDSGQGFACNYEPVPDPLVMPAEGVRERLEEALDASIVGCARCKVCDTQIGAAMTVLGPLLARAEAAEARLAAITDACRSIPSPIANRILAITGSEEGGAFARQLVAQAKAADAEYKVAAVRAGLYEFLHQYGQSVLPTFQAAIDLAVSLRKIIDDLGSAEDPVRGGSYDVWGADFGVEGGKA